ncbi:555_t:CDS:2 [Cetraspora pellucida]|uniref:555_t:CDS:1 n=1 Tax=Cetraspora pellucida TaxID=1433469 RepID=A0A9N9GUS6_9GLOM|nr:555_t:CDS:2 [Cetraspora pellucida]
MGRHGSVGHREIATPLYITLMTQACDRSIFMSIEKSNIYLFLRQFDDAFEGIRSVYKIRIERTFLTDREISRNIAYLKRQLGINIEMYKLLLSFCELNNLPKSDLTWENPLAIQTPFNIENMCNNFVENFHNDNIEALPLKFSHNKFAEGQSEGTYITDVIMPLIQSVLKKLSIKKHVFFSMTKRQSLASVDRRAIDGKQDKCLDIMLIEKHHEKLHVLLFAECSCLICNDNKKKEDEVKLWQEINDRMYYVHKTCKPDKDKFGIIGIQIAENEMHLNVLIKDKNDIYQLYHYVVLKF